MKVREDFLRGVSNCLWNKTLAGGESSPLQSAADPGGGDGLHSRQELEEAVLKDDAATSQSLFALELVVRRWF